MSQMYRVRFARKLPNDKVDAGDCVVCAANADIARDSVAAILQFPVSMAEFEIIRVKPSLYLIGRREIDKSLSSAFGAVVDYCKASSATFPGVTEAMEEEYWHDIVISAEVRAANEEAAIVKLSRGVEREMNGIKQKSSIHELDIKCDRKAFHPRSPAIEQNGLYTHLRFFSGGDGRPK